MTEDRVEQVKEILGQPVNWVKGTKRPREELATYLTEPCRERLAQQIAQLFEPQASVKDCPVCHKVLEYIDDQYYCSQDESCWYYLLDYEWWHALKAEYLKEGEVLEAEREDKEDRCERCLDEGKQEVVTGLKEAHQYTKGSSAGIGCSICEFIEKYDKEGK